MTKDQFLKYIWHDFSIFKFFRLKDNKISYQNVVYSLFEITGIMKKFFKENLSQLTDSPYKTEYITDDLSFKNFKILQNLSVHTNIIESQYFGDQKTQILRNIPVKYKFDYLDLFLKSKKYVKVKDTVINTINIELYDICDNDISFNNIFTNIILTLHFKRRQ